MAAASLVLLVAARTAQGHPPHTPAPLVLLVAGTRRARKPVVAPQQQLLVLARRAALRGTPGTTAPLPVLLLLWPIRLLLEVAAGIP